MTAKLAAEDVDERKQVDSHDLSHSLYRLGDRSSELSATLENFLRPTRTVQRRVRSCL